MVVLAQEESRTLNHNYIGTEHILLGLIHEGEGLGAKALESMEISLEAVRSQVEDIIGQGQDIAAGHIPFTPRAKKVLELSLREALQLGHDYIGSEHILLGLVREGEGIAAQVLQKLGANLDRVRLQVIALVGARGGEIPGAGRSSVKRHLGKFALSEDGWGIMELAAEAAKRLGHPEILPADFLLAVITLDDPSVADLMSSWGVDMKAVRARIEELAVREQSQESEEEDGPAT